ncbi:hypothetical protein [Mucilaginibacter sp. CSA2-8R]|uniref:hypothetical protein n=1 Tax=Mucilaginibacter sp. CSA2-8R TaxID=3141542 RepID=UPI00315CF296
MKLKPTALSLMAAAIIFAGCSKDKFTEQDAVQAQKDLLTLQYQHDIDMETLKQKGATAMQQLINSSALAQLKMNDSLTRAGVVASRKQDYSVTVVDVVTNTPIADADVMVSSEGKMVTAKTNAQGMAMFNSLYLFPTSAFVISKTGYAATQILQQNITQGPAKLWNSADLSNEIYGTVYIETDLTNTTSEKVGEKVLVTATTTVYSTATGNYNVSFPAYTAADGSYSIKVPAAANMYSITGEQITADQKLFVNSTEDDGINVQFPNALPRLTTIKTYFNVARFNANVPGVYTTYYFKFPADKGGRVLSIPAYNPSYNYANNIAYVSAANGKFQVEKLNISSYYNNNSNYIDLSSYSYDANAKIDVQMVDVTGTLIQTPPQLMATTNASGRLNFYTSPEGGSGYVHLKRDASNALVANAKGVINRVNPYNGYYDSFTNLFQLYFSGNLNTATGNAFGSTAYQLSGKNEKRVVNLYYGSGDSRVKQVY